MSNSATESGPEVTSLPQFFPPVPMSESLKADTECGDGGIFYFLEELIWGGRRRRRMPLH